VARGLHVRPAPNAGLVYAANLTWHECASRLALGRRYARCSAPAMRLLLVCLLLCPGLAWAKPKPPTDPQISKSIQRGRAWLLKSSPKPMQMFGSDRSLVAFALLRSGVPAKELDPLFEEMAKRPLTSVYEAGLYALALEARALVAKDHKFPWRTRVRTATQPAALSELKRVAVYLLKTENEGRLAGTWGYGIVGMGKSYYDNSNSQFAVYGLAAASRSGVEVDPGVWDRILRHWLNDIRFGKQRVGLALEFGPFSPFAKRGAGTRVRVEIKEGGWGYSKAGTYGVPYTSMTAAGVSSLAYVLERLRATKVRPTKLHERAKEATLAGLAWVQRNLGVALVPDTGDANGWVAKAFPFYGLWSLEKACDSTHTLRIKGQDWWRWGARWVLDKQLADGRWDISIQNKGFAAWGGARIRTAFALLYLSRATLPAEGATEKVIEIEDATPRGGRARTGAFNATWDIVVLKDGRKVSLWQSLESLPQAQGREKRALLKEIKEGWQRLAPEWQAGLVPLLHELERERGSVRSWARQSIKRLVPDKKQRARLGDFVREWQRLQRAVAGGLISELPYAAEVTLRAEAPEWLRLRGLRTLEDLHGLEQSKALVSALQDDGLRARAREVLAALFPPTAELPDPPAPEWGAWAKDLRVRPDAILRRNLDLYLEGKDGTKAALLKRRGAALLFVRGIAPDLKPAARKRADELVALLDPPPPEGSAEKDPAKKDPAKKDPAEAQATK
jgi:hypothetical protein